MSNFLKPEVGTFILRVSLGVILIAHSLYLKLMVFSLPGTAQYFASIGLPGVLAYIVFLVESIAGIALILGIKTRLFAALVAPILIGATWTHWPSGWLFSNNGGGWEFPLFLLFASIALVFMGNGKYALGNNN